MTQYHPLLVALHWMMALHVAAALYRQFVRGDGLLLPGGR